MNAIARVVGITNGIVAGVVVLGYIALMCQKDGWFIKWTLLFNVQGGLFYAHVLPGGVSRLAASVVMSKISDMASNKDEEEHLLKPLRTKKYWTVQETREWFCHVEHTTKWFGARNLCDIWSGIQVSTMIFAIMIPMGLSVLIAGFAVEYYHINVRPRVRSRRLAVMLYSMAAGILWLGLILWMITVSFLSEIKPHTAGLPYGLCPYFAIVLNAIATVPLCLCLYYLRLSNVDEIRNENLSAEKRFMREYGYQIEYGATGDGQQGGMAPMYAGQPAMDQQAVASGWRGAEG